MSTVLNEIIHKPAVVQLIIQDFLVYYVKSVNAAATL